jgi:hypothetical protein
MTYQAALIYDAAGLFRGYSILSPAGKLKSTNIWTEEESAELHEQIKLLNSDAALREHWPSPADLDVWALVNDATWESLDISMGENELAAAAQLRIRKAFETIARMRSHITA